jgi:glycerol uptake facilitator protein
MTSAFWGELAGTGMMILLGNGVVAGTLLKGSYGHGAGWMAITAGWCFAVLAGILTALALGSHAHLNPAVTIGIAFVTGQWEEVPAYFCGQLLGAMLGALGVWLHYLPHWGPTEDAGAKRSCFCTSPAIRNLPANLCSEVIATFVLVLLVETLSSTRVAPSGLSAGAGPVLVGFLVWGIGLSLGGTTGYAINPARDLGPRIMHALLPIGSKTASGWDYALVPVLGPSIGATLAGLVVRGLAL